MSVVFRPSSLLCLSHLSAEKQLLSAGRVCARCREVVRSDVPPVTLRGAVAVGAWNGDTYLYNTPQIFLTSGIVIAGPPGGWARGWPGHTGPHVLLEEAPAGLQDLPVWQRLHVHRWGTAESGKVLIIWICFTIKMWRLKCEFTLSSHRGR